MKANKVLSFLGKWLIRWVFLALPLSVHILTLQGSFLYRPGFWEIWWLINTWATLFAKSLLLSFPFSFLGLIPGRFYTHLAGFFLCCYISPIVGILIYAGESPLLWLTLLPIAGMGATLPPKSDKASALVHLAGLSLALFVLLHGKMLLEVVLFG